MDIETIKAIGEYIVIPLAGFGLTGFVVYILFR